ncbi:MAG: tetratricopeptide repeat protein [Alphaproteobacteria bacterium]|nr:tetratricopeptide repeat protein [Alphaproteobacteria bacterium]
MSESTETSAPAAERWLSQATARIAARDGDGALIALRTAVALEPAGCEALLRLAELLAPIAPKSARAAAFAAAVADPHLERPFQTLQRLGADDEAMRLLRWITRTAPHQTDAWGWLAVLLHVGGDPAAAAPLYDEALKGRSDDVETLYKKGRALEDGGAVGEAETLYRHLEARMPNDHRVPFQLGLALHGQGRLAEAAAAYDRALFLAPAKGDIAANLAACQLNDPATTLDELCRSRRRWNARIERPGGPRPRPPRRDVAAPLSIGFVSGDFHTHQVAFLTVRTIEGLRAATPARIVCYANQTEADAMTARFQAAAHLWRPIRGLDDQSVADLIRGDGIDVLIDMSGLFVRNRLPMFVRRPAPLAVGWPCFTGATGLDEMDALLADAAEIPDRDEPLYSEHVLRMPGCWITWDPYAHAPPPAPPPSAAGGPVTFGSLSNPQKFNSRLAALWARVLDAVPGSRLLLRYAGLETPVLAKRIRTLFKVNGVPADRLFLEGHAPRREFLARYGAVDVALDPWPYSGGVTTLEALWMGVPVVSLPGPAFPGRHSASILGALGLGDWIARDEDDYVAIAARLAADLPGRTAPRHGLRQRIDVSPLCDGASHARHMYALLARCFDSEGRVRLPPPPAPEAGDLFRQAWACHNDGRTAEASRNYQAALVLEPRLGHALQNLGVIAFREDRLAEAKALFTHTTGLVPRDATARFNLGMVLDRLGETNACLASFRAAVILDPGHWGAFDLMGRLWWEKKSQAAAALGCFAAAAVLSPRDAGSRANKAAMLRSIDRPAEAIREAKAAVALTPGLAAALSILGNANTMAGRVRESLPFYRMAAHAEPAGAPLAHWNESLSRLMLGGFREGWELYEYRWKAPGFPSPRRDFTQPPWDGSPLDGRTVLVHWEQGFGDTLQFVRYLPMIGARGGRVAFECQSALLRLFQGLDGVDVLTEAGQTLPPFDVYAPLLSLPRLFDTTLDDIPDRCPYLAADPALVAAWRARLDADDPRPRIALTWKGAATHGNDRNRSLRLDWLAPLLRRTDIRFFSLQKDGADEARAAGLDHLGDEVRDFADSAAVMTLMDLVITADTAPAHLAGALGRPVWVFVPYFADWRWMRDREDSPWYPTMRLFRQPGPGAWGTVIERMAAELAGPLGTSVLIGGS